MRCAYEPGMLGSSVKAVPKRKKQRTNPTRETATVRVSVGKRLVLITSGLVLLACAAFAVHLVSTSRPPQESLRPAAKAGDFKRPKTLAELMAMKAEYLEWADIGLMNMLSAEGLPGAEVINVEDYLATLDTWAQRVKSETARNFHRFQKDPAYFYNLEAFYKMLIMAVVVYEDLDVRYNPKWIAPPSATLADDHFFADSRDVFIHGMLGPQRTGTCSSMPVLYIALGRRLGYPLKLVTTKGHLFVRWDTPTERFNMDATGKGLDRFDDEYYKKWPFPITEQEIQEEGYLKSLSPREELSVFFAIRGACFKENGYYALAADSFQVACALAPNWKGNQVMLAQTQQTMRPVAVVNSSGLRQSAMDPNIPPDPSPYDQPPSDFQQKPSPHHQLQSPFQQAPYSRRIP